MARTAGSQKERTFFRHLLQYLDGEMAEWSKALRSGRSPKGRGFESHSRQFFFFLFLPGVRERQSCPRSVQNEKPQSEGGVA